LADRVFMSLQSHAKIKLGQKEESLIWFLARLEPTTF